MGHKNQFPNTYNWQSTNPATGFLPLPANQTGSKPSGVVNGVMSGTSTIYSNIIDISRHDNIGLEVNWSGTPTGVFSVLVSNSGINFNTLVFNPVLAQPAGSAAGMGVNITQLGFKYILLQYVNTSGSGILTVYGQSKDLN